MGKFLNQYELLIKKARTDLAAAKTLFDRINAEDSELDIEVVYFHLQQSAEKSLKAVLSWGKVNYPKIHDLDTLLTMVHDKGIELETNSQRLSELNDYAVDGRYSIFMDDLENADKYFSLVSELMKSVEKIISGF